VGDAQPAKAVTNKRAMIFCMLMYEFFEIEVSIITFMRLKI
jgi:hypothetical protein